MSRRGHQTAIGYPVPGTGQSVVIGASSQSSTAVGQFTDRIAVFADADCFVNLEGAATASDAFLPANQYVMLSCKGGQSLRVIQSTGGGTLRFYEVSSLREPRASGARMG